MDDVYISIETQARIGKFYKYLEVLIVSLPH